MRTTGYVVLLLLCIGCVSNGSRVNQKTTKSLKSDFPELQIYSCDGLDKTDNKVKVTIKVGEAPKSIGTFKGDQVQLAASTKFYVVLSIKRPDQLVSIYANYGYIHYTEVTTKTTREIYCIEEKFKEKFERGDFDHGLYSSSPKN